MWQSKALSALSIASGLRRPSASTTRQRVVDTGVSMGMWRACRRQSWPLTLAALTRYDVVPQCLRAAWPPMNAECTRRRGSGQVLCTAKAAKFPKAPLYKPFPESCQRALAHCWVTLIGQYCLSSQQLTCAGVSPRLRSQAPSFHEADMRRNPSPEKAARWMGTM